MRVNSEPLALPYDWHPMGALPVRTGRPQADDLIPLAHVVYRVLESRRLPRAHWTAEDRGAVSGGAIEPYVLHLRPVDAVDSEQDVFAGTGGAHTFRFDRYPSAHYPICADCREPLPCRDQVAAELSAAAIERLSRFEDATRCPACGHAVTRWQRSRTWADNAVIPGGPAVTFHLRSSCRRAAAEYARALTAQASPAILHQESEQV